MNEIKSIPPSVPTLSITAFVESRHWFISRSGLDLHEVGSRMLAFWTRFCQETQTNMYAHVQNCGNPSDNSSFFST